VLYIPAIPGPELTGGGQHLLGTIGVGARTGYGIKRRVDASTRFFRFASPGHIDPELERDSAEGRPTFQALTQELGASAR
jgi:DNA-binding PadR family transcriptional regulator